MTDEPVDRRPWPPAFSETFLAGARRLFADTNHVMIVGPLGSHRGALATAVAGASVATAWGRDAQTFGADGQRYAALNRLLPTMRARPDRNVEDVIAMAAKILEGSFGLQTICIHEADLCDSGSLDVLAHLVESGRIAVVSTVGEAAAASHRFARSAARIDLAPLDDTSISQLLEERYGAVPHPTTVAMLMHRSQGAYAVLKELAEAAFTTGQIKVLAGVLVTDADVSVDDVDDAAKLAATAWSPRFTSDHPGLDLIDVAALTRNVDLAEALTAFGEAAVIAAVEGGAVRVDGDRLAFTSRVEAMLIRHHLTDERRAALYERYAADLSHTATLSGVAPRVANWFGSIGRPLTADLAVRAATQANRECRYLDALTFVEAIAPAERPSRLLIEQCHALSESGAESELLDLIASIEVTTLNEDDLLPFLVWSVRHLAADDVTAMIRALIDGSGANDARRAVVELLALHGAAFDDGSDEVRRHLITLSMSDRLSPVNRSVAQTILASSLRHVSRLDQANVVATEAVRALDELGDAVCACTIELAMEVQILCRLSAADYAGAHDALTAYSSTSVAYGNLGRHGTALWGLHAFFSGNLPSAVAYAQLALARLSDSDPHRLRGWMEAMAAQILTQVGDIDNVVHLLESSARRPRSLQRQFDLESRLTRACVHDAIGDPDQALDILQEVIDEAQEHELVLSQVDAAVLMVQIGGPMHLRQLLRAVEPIDETCGSSWIWRRFAWAVRDNDMRGLVALAEELDADGKSLFAAEVAQFTLDVARRAADMSPQQRERLVSIADPMQHRHVVRSP